MTTSIEEMQKHLETLAAELSCVMIQGSNMEGMMYVEEEPSRIETPKLEYGVFGGTYRYTPRIAYMVGLHELGHVYHDTLKVDLHIKLKVLLIMEYSRVKQRHGSLS